MKRYNKIFNERAETCDLGNIAKAFIPLVKKYARKESCLLCMDIMTLLQTAGVDIPEFKKNMGEYNHETL